LFCTYLFTLILGLVKVIEEYIENNLKEKALKCDQMERIDTNMTKIVPIMMMTKQGAAEDYFDNILQKYYSPWDSKYCLDTVESWSTDLADASAKDFEFMELLDTLLNDDQYRQRAQNDEKFKKMLRIALNLVYLRIWKTSPDFEVFALKW
jgi:hypothetical protein